MAEHKTVSARESSKWAQIIAALWIGCLTICKAVWNWNISISDIVFSGLAIAACFLPVYFSIIMDKIKEMKLGKE